MTIPDGVVVLVRQGCHLCDEAVPVVAAVCTSAGVPWACLDVHSDDDLRDRYTDHVPVTFVDGTVLSYWFVDPRQLESALATR